MLLAFVVRKMSIRGFDLYSRWYEEKLEQRFLKVVLKHILGTRLTNDTLDDLNKVAKSELTLGVSVKQ